MTYQLTESLFKEIVKECVIRYLKGETNTDIVLENLLKQNKKKIFEMSLKRKDYKDRVNALAEQIIENIALLCYCSIYCDNLNKRHWQTELRAHLMNIVKLTLKGGDSNIKREEVIREVWDDNDYFTPKAVDYTIDNKFREEGLPTDTKEYMQIVYDTISSFKVLIPALSSGDKTEIDKFMSYISK